MTTAAKPKPLRTKIMVTLRLPTPADATQSAAPNTQAPASGRYRANRAQYAARKQQAMAVRDQLVTWLKTNATSGSFRKVSDVTIFGTLTLDATNDLIAQLQSHPLVESADPVDDAPLTLLNT